MKRSELDELLRFEPNLNEASPYGEAAMKFEKEMNEIDIRSKGTRVAEAKKEIQPIVQQEFSRFMFNIHSRCRGTGLNAGMDIKEITKMFIDMISKEMKNADQYEKR